MSFEVWSVTFTEYSDDYKSRGDDWSNTTNPELFLHYKTAEQYLCGQLVVRINEKMDGSDFYLNRLKEANLMGHFENVIGGDYMLRSSRYQRLRALEKIANVLMKGEYVVRTLSWQIVRVEVCCSTPDPTDDESTEDSESEEKATSTDDANSKKRSAEAEASDGGQKAARAGEPDEK